MLKWEEIIKKDLAEPSDGPKVGDTYVVGMHSKSTWKRIEKRNGCEEICEYTTPEKIPGTEWESEVTDTIYASHPEYFEAAFLTKTREGDERDAQVRRLQRTLREWPTCNLTGRALDVGWHREGQDNFLTFICLACSYRICLCESCPKKEEEK